MTSAENRNAVRAAEAKAKNIDEEKIIVVQGGDAIIYHVDPNDLKLEESFVFNYRIMQSRPSNSAYTGYRLVRGTWDWYKSAL